MSPIATGRRAAKLLRRHTGLLSIAGGSAAGQLTAFLLLPILSRLSGPADFGAPAGVAAFAGTPAALATAGPELAGPMARADDGAFRAGFPGLAGGLVGALMAGGGLAVFGE